jgi:hypothetical protein
VMEYLVDEGYDVICQQREIDYTSDIKLPAVPITPQEFLATKKLAELKAYATAVWTAKLPLEGVRPIEAKELQELKFPNQRNPF